MLISKETIVKIELKGNDLETFKSLLKGILSADTAGNAGIGFLTTDERKYVENILKSISNE